MYKNLSLQLLIKEILFLVYSLNIYFLTIRESKSVFSFKLIKHDEAL